MILVIEELAELIVEFGAEEVYYAFRQSFGDSVDGLLRRIDLNDLNRFGTEFVAGIVIEAMVTEATRLAFPNSDVETIVPLAGDISTQFSLLVAATHSGSPATSGIFASLQTYQVARASALSSFEEDDNFRAVATGLAAADRLRELADSARARGDDAAAGRIQQLAENTVSDAAQLTGEVFSGVDGPIIADLVREMDTVIQIWRSGNQAGAQEAWNRVREQAENSPSTPTNDFYERFFMIGRASDVDRATQILWETLNSIAESDS